MKISYAFSRALYRGGGIVRERAVSIVSFSLREWKT